jgi:hypothetical protein
MSLRTRIGRKVLGTLISAAVAFSILPSMAFADGTDGIVSVPLSIESTISANSTTPIGESGIKVSTGEYAISVSRWGRFFNTARETSASYTFALDSEGTYNRGVITKIEISGAQASYITDSYGDGWSLSNGTLTWEGTAADSVAFSVNGDTTRRVTHYLSFSSITVYVKVPATSLTITDEDGAESGYAYVDDTIQLSTALAPENTTFTTPVINWSADGAMYRIEVDETGLVSVYEAGEYVVTAAMQALPDVTDTYEVSVYEHVAGVSISSDSETDSILVDDTVTLTVEPTNNDKVRADDWSVISWSSSDESVATVDETTGVVTGVGAGEATITVTVEDSGNSPVKTHDATYVINVTEPAPDCVVMHRLYNPNSGEHFYTSDEAEFENLVNLGWQDEGIGWIAPATSNTPVYRLYNPNAGEHHYTTSVGERDNLVSLGWNDEGIGWYSDDEQAVPVYRQYNPNEFANNHNYTASEGERDNLISLGWLDENIGWYGLSPLQPA